jgi:holliday junction DNA helicase RuvB
MNRTADQEFSDRTRSDRENQKPRLLSGASIEEDHLCDNNLRPKTLDEYVGQESARENLRVFISASKLRGECLDHILLKGPPGLGKTTLAMCIAQEMGAKIKVTSGPAIERPIDMLVLLKNLNPGDVLFIDEIHRLNRNVEEILYPAMEDFVFDRVIGKGPRAASKRIPIPRFTLVGATTRSGMLSSPLRDRFGINFNLSFYGAEELKSIVKRSAGILESEIDDEAAEVVAFRSRGTPRIANRMLRRVRDYAQVRGTGRITDEIADYALNKMGIDALGLDEIDRRILDCLVIKFRGKPVGLETLAAYVQEDPDNIEEVYEPYLLQAGFMAKTPRGRVASPEAFRYLGKKMPKSFIQGNLWE